MNIKIICWKNSGELSVILNNREYTYYYVDEYNQRKLRYLISKRSYNAAMKLLKRFSRRDIHVGDNI